MAIATLVGITADGFTCCVRDGRMSKLSGNLSVLTITKSSTPAVKLEVENEWQVTKKKASSFKAAAAPQPSGKAWNQAVKVHPHFALPVLVYHLMLMTSTHVVS